MSASFSTTASIPARFFCKKNVNQKMRDNYILFSAMAISRGNHCLRHFMRHFALGKTKVYYCKCKTTLKIKKFVLSSNFIQSVTAHQEVVKMSIKAVTSLEETVANAVINFIGCRTSYRVQLRVLYTNRVAPSH